MNEKHHAQQPSTKRSSSSKARKLFFLIASLWGYFLGWAAIFIIGKRCGVHPQFDLFDVSVIVASAILAGIGALVFHRTYREYRKKKYNL